VNSVGEALPPLVEEITARRVVMGPGATGDYFPGHWDPAYAAAQGQPAIYANSLMLFGLLDKAATEWGGPTSFVVRRAVQLQLSLYAGDTATVTRPEGLVDLQLVMTNQHGGTVCAAEMTLRLQ
jgi:acyl dehydratase